MSAGPISRSLKGLTRRRRALPRVVGVLAVVLIFAAGATAAGRKFPVPTCRWAPTSLIKNAFGVRVRATKPVWSTDIAPVLACGYVETQPQLQFGNANLVTIQFRELQRFKPPKGWTFVRGLGSCVEGSSCPEPHKAAWLHVIRELAQPPPYGKPFISILALRVEDGLNSLTILVENPNGPLPVGNEIGRAERLAKKLLPRFYWR